MLLAGLMIFLFACGVWMELSKVNITTETFRESARQLSNPNQGFYKIYGFTISDGEEDYWAQVESLYQNDPDTTIALVEINLQNYREGEISQAGLKNIEALFRALKGGEKRLIVRFLYDLEGKSLIHEPRNLEIILKHMEQLEEILRGYKDCIFTMQGLFVGNWGEMHGTKYDSDEDLRALAQKLASITDESTYLAVRTPAQWRVVTLRGEDQALAARLGLFNDGILGSENDLGTYDLEEQGEERRRRSQELAFQEEICASVPNGGEVVVENPYNDFENAVKDLATMHVSYLNQDYDQEVLDKWARATVAEKGCFQGMDGLNYIQRHLGCRLLIQNVSAGKKAFQNWVSLSVSFQNVGFAPIYAEPRATVTFWDEAARYGKSYPLDCNLRALTGGHAAGKSTAQLEIPLEDLPRGNYTIYLSLMDPSSETPIQLANTQDLGNYGYRLGSVEIKYGPKAYEE